jgi:phage terminase small subunit
MRPRKPTQLKVITGTTRPDRPEQVTELPVVDALPDPPDWLPNAHAVKEWKRLGPILVANRLITEGGLSAFGMLCSLHGKIVQLYAAGEAPNGAMIQQWRALTNDFGLTPAAQGKVRAMGAEPAGNKFADRGKKPEAATK